MSEMSHSSPITVMVLIVFQFVVHPQCAHGVNLNACCAKLQGPPPPPPPNTTGPPPPPPPLIVSYGECLEKCGTGMGDIDWQTFSQNFGTWFLPWISLMFQIPFGAERKFRHKGFISHQLITPCIDDQSRRMTSSPSSSPWVHPPLPHTPSRLHT